MSGHIAVARDVLEHIDPNNLIFCCGRFWQWRSTGIWERVDDREMKKLLHVALDSMPECTFSSTTVNSALELLKTECFRSDQRWDFRADVINTRSGVLSWDHERGEWEMESYRREDYMTVQIPVAHDPKAECPRFEQFLREIFADDADCADKSMVVLELIGYSLLTTCRFEKFVLMIGSGGNGKSKILDVVEALVGSKSVCAVQPSKFDNQFQRAHLAGKLVNIVTEIAEGAEIADAQLKAIVSGELTTAEHKNQDPFDFHPYATCWFGTNHLPHTRDFSDAMFRRAIVLTFNNKFEGARCDPDLSAKLRKELPGILNLALIALKGVFLRQGFTAPESSEEAKQEWRLACDQAAQYCKDRCIFDASEKVGSTTLYGDYKEWAQDQGIRHWLSQKSLIQKLSKDRRVQCGRSSELRYLVGIRLRCFSDSIGELS